MTFLVITWVIALLSVLGVLSAAFFEVRGKKPGISRGLPYGWWDMYVLTYQDIVRALVDYWHDFMPHVHTLATHALSKILAHRDRTYAKLFGYPAVPHGGAVSFFLKRIVEHKEEFRQRVADRRLMHSGGVERRKQNRLSELPFKGRRKEDSTK